MRHKLLAGIIPFCSGKRKPSTFTSSSLTDCNHITTNNNMLHSKSTYFYRWSSRYISIAPISCALTLLVGIGLFLNPAAKAQEVYAAEEEEKCINGQPNASTGQCPMELSLTMDGTTGNSTYEEVEATQLEVNKTTYRSYSFKVSATDIDRNGYRLYTTAVETKVGETDYTNQLVNADYPDKGRFVPISNIDGVAGENMNAGEWGYAIAGGNTGSTLDTANTNPGTLTYKPVPTSQTAPIATGTETTTTDSGIPDNPATVPDKYKLIFGAKAAEDMPSGHYRTQVMLSLVAEPRKVIHTMQNFTPKECAELGEAGRILTDDRTASGLGKTDYWVARLKDGHCWMTQDLDLSLTTGDVLTSNDTDIKDASGKWSVNALAQYGDLGLYVYKNPSADLGVNCSSLSTCDRFEYIGDGFTPSKSPTFGSATSAIDLNTKTYNAHYKVGNHYSFITATAGKATENAGSICPKGWRLPTSSEYQTMIKGLDQHSIRKSPYSFIPTGSGAQGSGAGNYAYYWTSTASGSGAYYVKSSYYSASQPVSTGVQPTQNIGYSVRCIYNK